MANLPPLPPAGSPYVSQHPLGLRERLTRGVMVFVVGADRSGARAECGEREGRVLAQHLVEDQFGALLDDRQRQAVDRLRNGFGQ